jgi:hypothetical protein
MLVVILVFAFVTSAVAKLKYPTPVHFAMEPLPFVDRPFLPSISALAMELIVLEIPEVKGTIDPSKLALPVFHTGLVDTFEK